MRFAWLVLLASTAYADHTVQHLTAQTDHRDQRVAADPKCTGAMARTRAGTFGAIHADIVLDCGSDANTRLAIETKPGWTITKGVTGHVKPRSAVPPSSTDIHTETLELVAPKTLLHRVVTEATTECEHPCKKSPTPVSALRIELCKVDADVMCAEIEPLDCPRGFCPDVTYRDNVLHVGKDEYEIK